MEISLLQAIQSLKALISTSEPNQYFACIFSGCTSVVIETKIWLSKYQASGYEAGGMGWGKEKKAENNPYTSQHVQHWTIELGQFSRSVVGGDGG